MKAQALVLQDRDIRILRFLWKWKSATTMVISKIYFPNSILHHAYMRLLLLQKHGFIGFNNYSLGGNCYIWILKKKGFMLVKPQISGIRENGFLSENLYHDHLVTSIHLGDSITETPKNLGFFSEQELRRIDPELYPEGIPNDEDHRSDGYWILVLLR